MERLFQKYKISQYFTPYVFYFLYMYRYSYQIQYIFMELLRIQYIFMELLRRVLHANRGRSFSPVSCSNLKDLSIHGFTTVPRAIRINLPCPFGLCHVTMDGILSILIGLKQNKRTEGCSKFKRSVDMRRSGMNGLNIRTNASPKWCRARCPEEKVSFVC